ncbi:MAG TPA: AAA family ATPase [Thermomicrobiaceae bacterium]|nr:AAA family ATPase [Thermomicrobiaceae bacterium]
MSSLHVKLLGAFSLNDGDIPLASVATPRLQSLLAYLILHRDAPQPRQRLAYLFWPDSTEQQARTNLRRELHHLRQALPQADRVLSIQLSTLQWLADSAGTVDVVEFEDALAAASQAAESSDRERLRASLERAVAGYHGALLPDCYDDWISAERDRLHDLARYAQGQLIALLEEERDYAAAVRVAERLLDHDPLDEAACRTVMRLRALTGQRTAALRAYRAYAARLARELDLEPESDTRALYEQLRSVDLPGAPGAQEAAAIPLVGRVAEWRQLMTAWRHATEARGELTLIAGEAGIGKSRLAEELRVWLARQGVATAAARSYAAEGEHVYGPVVEWLRSPALRQALVDLDTAWLSELARLIPELLVERPDLPRPEQVSPGAERRRLAEALARAFRALGRPLLLVLDDLQWTDAESIEWLGYLFHHEPRMPLLVVGSVRPEEVGPAHPLAALIRDLQRSEQIRRIELGALDRRETTQLADQVAGRALDPDLAGRVHRETEGNPLFIVEAVRAGLTEASGHPASEPGNLPPKVSAVIAARLVQLSPAARELAGLAATIGRAFSLTVLLEASPLDDETVVRALDELCARHLVRERGAERYDFSHDKLREVAYAELSAARRQLLHRRVAQALESSHAPDLESVSAQLAAHYKLGGLREEAIRFYEIAGESSLRLSAYQDGITHVRQALELLATLPATHERARREARLQTGLGVALMATKGWPTDEVGEAYGRAQALYQREGEQAEHFQLFWGLWGFYVVRGDLSAAREIGEQALAIATARADRDQLLVAHLHLGTSLYHLGAIAAGREHLEQAIALYDPAQHGAHALLFGPDLGVFSLAYLSHVLWHQGFPDQAIARSRESLRIARERDHPYSLAIALDYAAMLAQFRRERPAARELADAAIELCEQREFAYYLAWTTILRGWSLTGERDITLGQAEMRRGLTALRAMGAGLRQTYYLALLAESHLEAGQPDQGMMILAEAWACLRANKERYWEPELHRLQAELRLAQGASEPEVEEQLQRAIAVARGRHASSLELRATMSLSRFWRRQGRGEEARGLLGEVYGSFSEGFDTVELRDAAAFLDQPGS